MGQLGQSGQYEGRSGVELVGDDIRVPPSTSGEDGRDRRTGEMLASSTVKDLVSGSGPVFGQWACIPPKGVPDE